MLGGFHIFMKYISKIYLKIYSKLEKKLNKLKDSLSKELENYAKKRKDSLKNLIN